MNQDQSTDQVIIGYVSESGMRYMPAPIFTAWALLLAKPDEPAQWKPVVHATSQHGLISQLVTDLEETWRIEHLEFCGSQRCVSIGGAQHCYAPAPASIAQAKEFLGLAASQQRPVNTIGAKGQLPTGHLFTDEITAQLPTGHLFTDEITAQLPAHAAGAVRRSQGDSK